MTIADIIAPSAEPVTLERAKEFLRVDGAHEDALIRDLIMGARLRVEQMARTSLISRRRAYNSHRVFTHCLYINHSPISAVVKVSVVDSGDVETEIPLEDILINRRAIPATLSLTTGKCFSDYAEDVVGVIVEIEAGYGAAPEDVPMPLRQALLLLLAQSYECRDKAAARPVPMLVDALLMPYRTVRI